MTLAVAADHHPFKEKRNVIREEPHLAYFVPVFLISISSPTHTHPQNQTRTNQSVRDAEVTFGIHTKSPELLSSIAILIFCFLRSVCFRFFTVTSL